MDYKSRIELDVSIRMALLGIEIENNPRRKFRYENLFVDVTEQVAHPHRSISKMEFLFSFK